MCALPICRAASSKMRWPRSSPPMPNCWRCGASNPAASRPSRGEAANLKPPSGPCDLQATVGLTFPDSLPSAGSSAAGLTLPPRLGRNHACSCGSGNKYKRCCWERDPGMRRQLGSAAIPGWLLNSRDNLQQFEPLESSADLPLVAIRQPYAPALVSPLMTKLYQESNLRLAPNRVALHPADARASGVSNGAHAILQTRIGKCAVDVTVDPAVPPGAVLVGASPGIQDVCGPSSRGTRRWEE